MIQNKCSLKAALPKDVTTRVVRISNYNSYVLRRA